ncbi:MAG: right-handed parallel beta-helix repeat-containing protein [Chitinispirillaceae bacterium]
MTVRHKAFLFFLLLLVPLHAQQKKVTLTTAVSVSTASELIEAIASNTDINLREGTYNLSEVNQVLNEHIEWKDNFDGYYPRIKEVSRLSLKGDGDVTILIAPRYGWVLEFMDCRSIQLDNITLGHTQPGTCLGGVVSFIDSDSIKITDCVLFGSGTIGIEAKNVRNLLISNSIVKECTYGLLSFEESENIKMVSSRFIDSEEFDLIQIRKSRDILFQNCLFRDNKTNGKAYELFTLSPDCVNVTISGCNFEDNSIVNFVNNPGRIECVSCQFTRNSFDETARQICR